MIFNLSVTFSGIFSKFFPDNAVRIRVTKTGDIFRLFVLDMETGTFIPYESWLKNSISKYNVTDSHIEKLKKAGITGLDGAQLSYSEDDFDVLPNPVRELDFFIRGNIKGDINEFSSFIENTVPVKYVTTDYILYKLIDVDTSFAKICGAKFRLHDGKYICDVDCIAKVYTDRREAFYVKFDKKDYIVDPAIVSPSRDIIDIPKLYGKYTDISDELLENSKNIAYNDTKVFTESLFLEKLNLGKCIVDFLRKTLVPYRNFIDVCSQYCPVKKYTKGSVMYETSITMVQNTILNVYGVYCKRNDIISAFDKLIEKAL